MSYKCVKTRLCNSHTLTLMRFHSFKLLWESFSLLPDSSTNQVPIHLFEISFVNLRNLGVQSEDSISQHPKCSCAPVLAHVGQCSCTLNSFTLVRQFNRSGTNTFVCDGSLNMRNTGSQSMHAIAQHPIGAYTLYSTICTQLEHIVFCICEPNY